MFHRAAARLLKGRRKTRLSCLFSRSLFPSTSWPLLDNWYGAWDYYKIIIFNSHTCQNDTVLPRCSCIIGYSVLDMLIPFFYASITMRATFFYKKKIIIVFNCVTSGKIKICVNPLNCFKRLCNWLVLNCLEIFWVPFICFKLFLNRFYLFLKY